MNSIKSNAKLPIGNEIVVSSTVDLGSFLRDHRKLQGLTQKDIAGLGNTGNRLIVEIESGKKTVQLQKVIDFVSMLGLELVIRKRGVK